MNKAAPPHEEEWGRNKRERQEAARKPNAGRGRGSRETGEGIPADGGRRGKTNLQGSGKLYDG